MHNVYSWLAMSLALLAVGVRFAQFATLRDKRPIKTEITDWYVSMARGNRSSLFVSSAQITERFLSFAFGDRILSVRFIMSALLVALVANLIAFGRVIPVEAALVKSIYQGSHSEAQYAADVLVASYLTLIVAPSMILDIASLAIWKVYFRLLGRRTHLSIEDAAVDILAMCAVAYLVSYVIVTYRGYAAALSLFMGAFHGFSSSHNFLLEIVGTGSLWPVNVQWIIPSSELYAIFLFTILSPLLFVLILLGTASLYVSRPATQTGLAIIVEVLTLRERSLAYAFGLLAVLTVLFSALSLPW